MIRSLRYSIALLLVVAATCQASFDFSVLPVAYNSATGDATLRVAVTNSNAVASTGITKIDAPLKFGMSGGMTSAQLTSLNPILSGFGTFASQNDVPLVLPTSVSNNQIIDFSGIYVLPSVTINAGQTINLWDVGIKLTQPGNLLVSLNQAGQTATNGLGFDSLGNGVALLNTVDGTLIPGVAGGAASYVSAVPEPSSFIFMGLVGVVVGGARWWKKRPA
ncbi:MAG: PEP-CTERM sorting domain-containing protein [Planctomycetales bacterium]|nr:PEP-CTERM sorting domain-containing protein [Planctomycetales bacterium]MCA9167714.1 PEP-CTERM sorting domain-containing protein [Planctomycetales bacterium]